MSTPVLQAKNQFERARQSLRTLLASVPSPVIHLALPSRQGASKASISRPDGPKKNLLIPVFDPSHDRYFLGRAQSGGFRGYFGHVFAKGSEVLQSKREAGVTLIRR